MRKRRADRNILFILARTSPSSTVWVAHVRTFVTLFEPPAWQAIKQCSVLSLAGCLFQRASERDTISVAHCYGFFSTVISEHGRRGIVTRTRAATPSFIHNINAEYFALSFLRRSHAKLHFFHGTQWYHAPVITNIDLSAAWKYTVRKSLVSLIIHEKKKKKASLASKDYLYTIYLFCFS